MLDRCLPIAISCLLGCVAAQTPYAELETTGGQNDTPATSEDCTMLGNYFVISGTIHAGGSPGCDDEWYRFDAAAGDTVDLDMTIIMAVATGSLYQHNFWLYDSTGTMVAAFNPTTIAPGGPSIGIETYTIPATDTYYIYVTEWSVSPNALSQPGAVFTPLAPRGYAVTGTIPDTGRNTAGGLQTVGSTYEITVQITTADPPPSCMLTSPLAGSMLGEDVTIVFDIDDPLMDPLDVTLEWSTDAGLTWQPASNGVGGSLTNPSVGVPSPQMGLSMVWDSRGDGVGIALVQSVDLLLTVQDMTTATACPVTIDIDNTRLCLGICGDCDENGMGVNILDALSGAQIAAGLIVPTSGQTYCCDVDSSGSVTVLDALGMAQEAAGLMPGLACL